MFGRGKTTPAQARRDREWQEFVKNLDGSGPLSQADRARMRVLLERATGKAPRRAAAAEPEDGTAEQAA
jgi:hypothetical protein